MPGLDGFEVIDELRKTSSDVKIIAMTGGGVFDKDEALDACRNFGITWCLEKPFDALELLQIVQECLKSLNCQD